MRDKEHATSNFEKDIYVLLKEQIIIDGIDVSECEDVTGLKYCDGYGDWCYLYPNTEKYFGAKTDSEQMAKRLYFAMRYLSGVANSF